MLIVKVNNLLATVKRRMDGTIARIRNATMSFVWNLDPRSFLFRSLYNLTKFRVIRIIRTNKSMRMILKITRMVRLFIVETGDCC